MGGHSVTRHIDTIRREMVKAIATVEIARLRKPVAMCWNKPATDVEFANACADDGIQLWYDHKRDSIVASVYS
jgi:hypothetical protein